MANIARRYSRALLQTLDQDSEALNQALSVLETLTSLFELKEAAALLKSPVIAMDIKKDVLKLGFKKDSKEVEALVLELLKQGRVQLLPQIHKELQQLLDEKKAIVRACVTTAVEMTEEQIANLKVQLKEVLGQSPVLTQKVDPSVLGGMLLDFEHKRIDLTLRTKFKKLAKLSEEAQP